MPEETEVLKGRDVRVTTQTLETGPFKFPIKDLGRLTIKAVRVTKHAKGESFFLWLMLSCLGATTMHASGMLLGQVTFCAICVFRRRYPAFALCSQEGAACRELYVNAERTEVEKLEHAIGIARTWSETNGTQGTVPKNGE